MRCQWIAWLLIAGCGRVAFDPISEGSNPTDDGGGSTMGDGSMTTGDGSTMIDAAPTACMSTEVITMTPGTPVVVDTCVGMEVFDGCGPANTDEAVFKFVVPTSGGYNFRARDPGTQNVSNTTGLINAGCTATATCAGIISRAFTAGEVLYFVVEASSGTCAQIEFENF